LGENLKINTDRGYWENKDGGGHNTDLGLANALQIFFYNCGVGNPEAPISVIDIGCGNGFYTMRIASSLVKAVGYDGNPHTPKFAGKLFKVADFSIYQDLGKFNWVLSLEVGEHIPPQYEDVFIDNLHRHNTDGIVLSWAVPEHGGEGHFNPQPNDYIIKKMESLGYFYDYMNTNVLRNSCAKYPKNCWWFSKTLMVFTKDSDGKLST
jgi:SAM-dependent methyltransferase